MAGSSRRTGSRVACARQRLRHCVPTSTDVSCAAHIPVLPFASFSLCSFAACSSSLSTMSFPRSSGLLLHPTSLPGPYGIGDLGPEAYKFADFLHGAGQKIWQVLPLIPTGYGDSPYQCFSAFAGNPLLLSLDVLVERGYLSQRDLDYRPLFPSDHVDFSRVIDWKLPLLSKAYDGCASSGAESAAYEGFCKRHAWWR